MFVSNQNVQRKDHHNSVLTIRAVITQQIYIFFLKKHKTRFQCAIICRNCFQFVRADVLQINIIFLFLVLKFHFFAMIFSSKTFDVDETILIFFVNELICCKTCNITRNSSDETANSKFFNKNFFICF